MTKLERAVRQTVRKWEHIAVNGALLNGNPRCGFCREYRTRRRDDGPVLCPIYKTELKYGWYTLDDNKDNIRIPFALAIMSFAWEYLEPPGAEFNKNRRRR